MNQFVKFVDEVFLRLSVYACLAQKGERFYYL
jgi:hypothetical protein